MTIAPKIKLSHWYAPYFSAGIFRRIQSIRSLRKETDADVYHVTGDTHFLVWGIPKRRRRVLTIHDVGFLRETKGLKRWILKYVWLVGPSKKAHAVTTVSLATKNEILREVPSLKKRIHVIPTVIDPRFTPQEKEFNATKPTILLIGSAPNKNVKRVLKACKGLSVHLSILAKLSEEEERILQGQSYEQASSVDFDTLLEKYRQADILMLCSTHEGFGMPILEAQATGRVVITSNCSSMPDVAGKGALLVDPLKVTKIRKGIEKVIKDEALRKQLIQDGFENVKRFDPAIVAEKYFDLYRSLARLRR